MIKRAALYKELFCSTFRLSAFTFGGGYVIVPLMRKRFVDELGWIDEEEMLDLVSIAQSTAERDLIAARTDAEKRTILAEAEASVKRIEADADAYKVKVQSEAEAAANKLIASSLTDSLIRYTQANRWNGSLPQIVGNSTALPVLDLTGADAN